MRNRVYFYITFNDKIVNLIFSDIISKINNHGLYDNCDKINLCVAGDINLMDRELLNGKDKYNLIQVRNSYEYDAIKMIWDDCQLEDINVCYIQGKGVRRPGDERANDWRNYMAYFNIEKWSDRVSNLLEYDCTGVNLGGNRMDYNEHPSTWGYGKAPIHYSGNFWWSKSSHIKKLKDPYLFWPDMNFERWRVLPEMWVCQVEDAKYHCAWSSGVNHYVSLYPRHLYDNKN